MSQTITAIYADGVLRPLTPLSLAEQTQVEVEIKRINGAAAPAANAQTAGLDQSKDHPRAPQSAATDERARIHQILIAAGLVTERPPVPPPSPPLSAEEEERLGRLFAVGKPLSEIIIEEREDRF